MSSNKIQNIVELCADSGINPMFWGKQGIGKSSIINAAAINLGMLGCKTMILSQREATDLIGMPKVDEVPHPTTGAPVKVSTNCMPDWLYDMWKEYAAAVDNGHENPRFILFLDELNRADRYAISAAHQLALENRIGEHELPPETVVVAACNPESDSEDGLTEFGDAFMDRFAHIEVLGTGTDDFMKFMKDDGWNGIVADFLEQDKRHVSTDVLKFEDILQRVKPSRRSWHAVARMMDKIGDNKALLNTAGHEIIRGLVGAASATVFQTFADKNFERTISIEDLIALTPKTKKRITNLGEKGEFGVLKQSLDKATDYFTTKYEKPSNIPDAEREQFLKALCVMPTEIQVSFWQGLSGNEFWLELAQNPALLPVEMFRHLKSVISPGK